MKNCTPIIIAALLFVQNAISAQAEFPSTQPNNGNFNRPLPNEVVDISPPGFCWWRAAPRGEADYRLRIEDAAGEPVYQSAVLGDPVHIPDTVLPTGDYRWFVDALDGQGEVITTRPAQEFSIAENALDLAWVEPEELLNRVPKEHPRLLLPHAELKEVRASLQGSRRAAYADLKKEADRALELELMTKPDFDQYDRETEYPIRRTAYQEAYREFTRTYNRGMVPLALMYMLSGEEKYGMAAKKHLLNVLDWEIDGTSSLELSFDEVGLRIARTAAQGYDWLYTLLTEEERAAVRRMLLARGDQMLTRLQGRDFLNDSAYSHDGRLPGYLLEFSIALAEEERAQVWMDYAMRALMTVFPHWGGQDGGWAEGLNYVLTYNERFITPLQSLYAATGYDLWKKSYFRNMRYFPMYCASPLGEITPFGDDEHKSVRGRSADMYSILHFHALHYRDSTTRWWIEQLDRDKENPPRSGAMHRIINSDDLKPEKPEAMQPDRAFHGIGWAALHSDILDPENDLMFLFKSSPFGPVSHSHADQNGFAIMKGGKALAHPSGARYPQHQSPFHFKYTNLTVAHNALLINGEGQIDREATANGKLTAFKSTPHLGYVAGDAQKCYGKRLDFYQRHVVMIRPSILLVIDDLAGPQPFSVDWLLHGKEEMTLDSDQQSIESPRIEEAMKTQLLTPGRFDFELTDEWPIDPKEEYPMATDAPPAKEWHFTASTREKSNRRRIAAIMLVKENGEYPACDVELEDGLVYLAGHFGDDKWSGFVRISTDEEAGGSLLELDYQPASGDVETIRIPME